MSLPGTGSHGTIRGQHTPTPGMLNHDGQPVHNTTSSPGGPSPIREIEQLQSLIDKVQERQRALLAMHAGVSGTSVAGTEGTSGFGTPDIIKTPANHHSHEKVRVEPMRGYDGRHGDAESKYVGPPPQTVPPLQTFQLTQPTNPSAPLPAIPSYARPPAAYHPRVHTLPVHPQGYSYPRGPLASPALSQIPALQYHVPVMTRYAAHGTAGVLTPIPSTQLSRRAAPTYVLSSPMQPTTPYTAEMLPAYHQVTGDTSQLAVGLQAVKVVDTPHGHVRVLPAKLVPPTPRQTVTVSRHTAHPGTYSGVLPAETLNTDVGPQTPVSTILAPSSTYNRSSDGDSPPLDPVYLRVERQRSPPLVPYIPGAFEGGNGGQSVPDSALNAHTHGASSPRRTGASMVPDVVKQPREVGSGTEVCPVEQLAQSSTASSPQPSVFVDNHNTNNSNNNNNNNNNNGNNNNDNNNNNNNDNNNNNISEGSNSIHLNNADPSIIHNSPGPSHGNGPVRTSVSVNHLNVSRRLTQTPAKVRWNDWPLDKFICLHEHNTSPPRPGPGIRNTSPPRPGPGIRRHPGMLGTASDSGVLRGTRHPQCRVCFSTWLCRRNLQICSWVDQRALGLRLVKFSTERRERSGALLKPVREQHASLNPSVSTVQTETSERHRLPLSAQLGTRDPSVHPSVCASYFTPFIPALPVCDAAALVVLLPRLLLPFTTHFGLAGAQDATNRGNSLGGTSSAYSTSAVRAGRTVPTSALFCMMCHLGVPKSAATALIQEFQAGHLTDDLSLCAPGDAVEDVSKILPISTSTLLGAGASGSESSGTGSSGDTIPAHPQVSSLTGMFINASDGPDDPVFNALSTVPDPTASIISGEGETLSTTGKAIGFPVSNADTASPEHTAADASQAQNAASRGVGALTGSPNSEMEESKRVHLSNTPSVPSPPVNVLDGSVDFVAFVHRFRCLCLYQVLLLLRSMAVDQVLSGWAHGGTLMPRDLPVPEGPALQDNGANSSQDRPLSPSRSLSQPQPSQDSPLSLSGTPFSTPASAVVNEGSCIGTSTYEGSPGASVCSTSRASSSVGTPAVIQAGSPAALVLKQHPHHHRNRAKTAVRLHVQSVEYISARLPSALLQCELSFGDVWAACRRQMGSLQALKEMARLCAFVEMHRGPTVDDNAPLAGSPERAQVVAILGGGGIGGPSYQTNHNNSHIGGNSRDNIGKGNGDGIKNENQELSQENPKQEQQQRQQQQQQQHQANGKHVSVPGGTGAQGGAGLTAQWGQLIDQTAWQLMVLASVENTSRRRQEGLFGAQAPAGVWDVDNSAGVSADQSVQGGGSGGTVRISKSPVSEYVGRQLLSLRACYRRSSLSIRLHDVLVWIYQQMRPFVVRL